MEFKKNPRRVHRPQSASLSPSHSRSTQNTVKTPTPDRTQPIMSGRSLKNKTNTKNHSDGPLRTFLFSKKGVILVVLFFMIIIGLLISRSTTQNGQSRQSTQNGQEKTNSSDKSSSNEKLSTPNYTTLTPGGKTIEELGGWRRVSPANSAPVFAYVDKIGDVSINVSQQPLPDSFKNNVSNQVAELAKKFNATTSFDAGSTKVYIGTSAKGPQSVIFSAKNLLILIKSEKNIDTKAWISYINSLT